MWVSLHAAGGLRHIQIHGSDDPIRKLCKAVWPVHFYLGPVHPEQLQLVGLPLAMPEYMLQLLGVEIYHIILLYVPNIKKIKANQEKKKYSVVNLIIDALSQLNLIRSLPLTKSYLDSVGGLLFQGHHKVGHNSYPNVMALLSGETGGDWPADWPNRTSIYYIDDHRQSLLPRVYQEHGYVTMMLEDLQLYGSLNREGKIGFRNPPAMIYYRAAFWAMLNEEWGQLRNRLIGKFGAYACLQEQMLHVPQLQTIKDFIETYSDEPSFAHIHLTEYLHNDINMAKLFDRDLKNRSNNRSHKI